MKIGIDTGFLIGLLKDDPLVLQYWQEVLQGQSQLVLSVLSINELLAYCYKRGTGDTAKRIVDLLIKLASVMIEPVTLEAASMGAAYRHGMGMATVDAIILATVVQCGCDLVLSKDQDFLLPAEQGVIKLILL